MPTTRERRERASPAARGCRRGRSPPTAPSWPGDRGGGHAAGAELAHRDQHRGHVGGARARRPSGSTSAGRPPRRRRRSRRRHERDRHQHHQADRERDRGGRERADRLAERRVDRRLQRHQPAGDHGGQRPAATSSIATWPPASSRPRPRRPRAAGPSRTRPPSRARTISDARSTSASGASNSSSSWIWSTSRVSSPASRSVAAAAHHRHLDDVRGGALDHHVHRQPLAQHAGLALARAQLGDPPDAAEQRWPRSPPRWPWRSWRR